MTSTTRTSDIRRLRLIISLGALLLALAHIAFPALTIDVIAVCLIVIAILPWLGPLVKSLELPGGWKVEFAGISKQIIEEKVSTEEKERLTRYQVVSSQSWEGGYYRLYSNGILTQRFNASVVAGQNRTDLVVPIAFPNEITSVEVIGDVAVNIISMTLGQIQLAHAPQQSAKNLTIVVTGL